MHRECNCNNQCCPIQCVNPCQPQCQTACCDSSKIVIANPNICCAPTICKQCTSVLTYVINITQPAAPIPDPAPLGTFSFFACVQCESCQNLIISWPMGPIAINILSRLTIPGTYTATIILNLLSNSCNPCFAQPPNSFSAVFTIIKTATGADTGSNVVISNSTSTIGTIQFTVVNGVFIPVGNFTPTINVPFNSSDGCNCCSNNICCVTLAFPPGTTTINPCVPNLCCGNGFGFR